MTHPPTPQPPTPIELAAILAALRLHQRRQAAAAVAPASPWLAVARREALRGDWLARRLAGWRGRFGR